MELYLSHILYPITNLGPGKRIGIWVQGCSLACPGCMTPELFQRNEKNKRNVIQIFNELNAIAPEYTGITISGGEPFEQASALLQLLNLIYHRTELDVTVYTGFTIYEILSGSQKGLALLSKIDILIDGRFKTDFPNKKVWRGSDNQHMYLLSKRAEKYKSFANAKYHNNRKLSIFIEPDGTFRIIGIPERHFTSRFRNLSKHKGLEISKRT